MSKYGKAVMFKVSDQQPKDSQQGSESANRLAETLLKKKKFLYIDMEDEASIKVLSRQSTLSDDSDEDAQVFGNQICVTNLRRLSRRSMGMCRYLGLLRIDTEKRSKLNKALIQFRSIRKLGTEPIQTILNSTQRQKQIGQSQDIRQFLNDRMTKRLRTKTTIKEKKLLQSHVKVSDFCRISKKKQTLNLDTPLFNESKVTSLPHVTPYKSRKSDDFSNKNLFFKKNRKL